MKKILTIALLVLLALGLFVACNVNAVEQLFEHVYNIILQANEHGTVTASVDGETTTTAAKDAEVTLTATPAEGYKFKEWSVVSGDVSITENKFTMPASNVTVMAVFEEIPVANSTFKAVYNTTGGANTLNFYYDAVDHSGDNITVYDNLPTAATKNTDWGYNSIRSNVKNVVIDESVKDYAGLTSTAFMFTSMSIADSISGAEYLDVSNVTDMSYMFAMYGSNSSSLVTVPNVSNWNTAKVTNMSYMFRNYGNKSTSFAAVPDVSKWNTGSVTNMSYMFNSYGSASEVLNVVPTVNGNNWNTANVTNMSYMFDGYGKSSKQLNATPDVSKWNTGNVTNISYMFREYGSSSTVLNAVPDVSKWNTGSVTNISYMFSSYGYSSTAFDAVPAVDGNNWNTENVTNMACMFQNYGYSSTALKKVPDVSKWDIGDVTDMNNMFNKYGSSSAVLEFKLDLSGWDLAGKEASNMFADAGISTTTWSVTIPATTDGKPNDPNNWYYGNCTNSIQPAKDKQFTMDVTVTFNLNGITGTAPEAQTITSGGHATEPTDNLPTLENHTLRWFTKAETTKLSDMWDFDWDEVTEDITLYAQWTRTLESILATNSEVPKADTMLNIPSNAWVNNNNSECKACFSEHNQGFILLKPPYQASDPFASIDEYQEFIKVNDSEYEFENDYYGFKAACCMVGGRFTSFVYEDTYPDYMFLNGTYAPAAPATYTVTFDPDIDGGEVHDSNGQKVTEITVPSGTTFSVSSNEITIGENVYTAVANSGWSFHSFNPNSGTITGATTIKVNFAQDQP